MEQEGWQIVSNKKQQKIKFDPIPNIKQQTNTSTQNNSNLSNSAYPLPNINLTNSTNSSHQDWNTITISKTQSKPKNPHTHIQNQSSSIKLDDSGEVVKIKRVSSQMSKAIIDARIAKKWSQVQLAQNACIDLKSLSEIERGGCVYDSNLFNKIAKTLGVKIDRNVDIN